MVLAALAEADAVTSAGLAAAWGCDHQKVVGAVKSLLALPVEMVAAELATVRRWELTAEGRGVAEAGSHEARVWGLVGEAGRDQQDLLAAAGPAGKVGFSKAMSLGWLELDKAGPRPVVRRKVPAVVDSVQQQLAGLLAPEGVLDAGEKERAEFKKRKLVTEITEKIYTLSKGPAFALTIPCLETELTPEMLQSGSWRGAEFKPYNFSALGVSPAGGHLHPLLKVRAEYRQIFLEMGFAEMPTNNYVESSFWNFDALFQPQQHPARDAHDTFFISDPAETDIFEEDYLERVKEVHSKGGFGSQGYGYAWAREEAAKNLLRTHTTAVSARMLYKLAQEKEFCPRKYFSIDRVFRNETLDATHLAEFHQVPSYSSSFPPSSPPD
jgi:phenylalanyl-tRNA synthetase alpha chain